MAARALSAPLPAAAAAARELERFPWPALPPAATPADRFWCHANPVTPNAARKGAAGPAGGSKLGGRARKFLGSPAGRPGDFRARPRARPDFPSLLPPAGPPAAPLPPAAHLRPEPRFGATYSEKGPAGPCRYPLPPAFGVTWQLLKSCRYPLPPLLKVACAHLPLSPAARFWLHAHLLMLKTVRQGVAGGARIGNIFLAWEELVGNR